MSLYNTGNYIQYPVISHNRKEYFKKECELSLVLCDGLEGRDGRRSKKEGLYVNVWPIHLVVEQKVTQHYKAIIPQF